MHVNYNAYDQTRDFVFDPAHAAATIGINMLQMMEHTPYSFAHPFFPWLRATEGVLSNVRLLTGDYKKPDWRIAESEVNGRKVPVTIAPVLEKPFGDLVHFRKEKTDNAGPVTLIFAPMSGHYATLLRDTADAMLPRHDVYMTDWKNARDVPLKDGTFGLDDYIDYAIHFMRHLKETTGKPVHVVAVCQPTVPVLAAIAHMEAINDAAVPATVTAMAGPIYPDAHPTVVTELAKGKTVKDFEGVTDRVPYRYAGAGRQVYPGFMQLAAFMAMNPDAHMNRGMDHVKNVMSGDARKMAKHSGFYEEYLAVMDLDARFYLETVDTVFIKQALPKGTLVHGGAPVSLKALHRPALLTIVGAEDDISATGQTFAAQALCENVRSKEHVEIPGVGHYGVFSGGNREQKRGWRGVAQPAIENFIARHDREHAAIRPQHLSKGRPAANAVETNILV